MSAPLTANWPVETICDHQSSGGPTVTHVRGTLLVSSLQMLREAGHFERYVTLLDQDLRDQVLFALAMSWVPLPVALAHYAACDALSLNERELDTLGEGIARRFADTFLATVLRGSRSAGLDAPWIALRAQARIWDRLYIGGAVKLFRVGPKDALAEFSGLPLARYRYFRVAYCGYYRGLASLLVKSPHVKPARSKTPDPDTLAIMGSWV